MLHGASVSLLQLVVPDGLHDDLEGRPLLRVEGLIQLWDDPHSDVGVYIATLLEGQDQSVIVETVVTLDSHLLLLHQ